MSAKPLWQACRDAAAPILQQLLRQGANPNAPWCGYPPLHTLAPGGFTPTCVIRLAAFSGAQAVVDLLHHRGTKEEELAPTQTYRCASSPSTASPAPASPFPHPQ